MSDSNGGDKIAISLDSDVVKVLDMMGNMNAPEFYALPIAEAVKPMRYKSDAPPPANSEDRLVPLGSGENVRVRFYFPDIDRDRLPIVMHLHGGGFVGGSIEMDDGRCARIAREAGCIIASVDYPLAPEHPFPEPIEAAYAVWCWLAASAAEFGGDPYRMAISGSSSGGHIAIGVMLLARDRGGPSPLLQLMVVPVTDPDFTSASYREFAVGPGLTRMRMEWFWEQYAANGAASGALWNPMTASLAGLPPAYVITAEYDLLRDEAETYAARLQDAGVPATVRRHPGMIHGFMTLVPNHSETANAYRECVAALRAALA